jgi:hypothetical protein
MVHVRRPVNYRAPHYVVPLHVHTALVMAPVLTTNRPIAVRSVPVIGICVLDLPDNQEDCHNFLDEMVAAAKDAQKRSSRTVWLQLHLHSMGKEMAHHQFFTDWCVTNGHETPPLSQETPPLIHKTPPLSHETPPLSQETLPLSQETPSLSHETQPLSYETPLLSYETPLLSSETPPLSQETPPLSHKTPLLSYETPPQSYETPPMGAGQRPRTLSMGTRRRERERRKRNNMRTEDMEIDTASHSDVETVMDIGPDRPSDAGPPVQPPNDPTGHPGQEVEPPFPVSSPISLPEPPPQFAGQMHHSSQGRNSPNS